MEQDIEPFSLGKFIPYRRNIVLLILFFLITPLTIATASFSLYLFNKPEPKVLASSARADITGVKVFASLPSNAPTVSGSVMSEDARPEIVKNYLITYNSSLTPYAKTLVEAADFYGLDFRLLPAIAQQESNLCKWIPNGTHNCWGWGIHSEGTLGFDSFDQAIWTVAKGLKENYIDEGLKTPKEIMAKYTPQSNGSWANGVSEFMAEID